MITLFINTLLLSAVDQQYLPLTVGSWWEHTSSLGNITINVLEADETDVVKYVCDTSFGISYVLYFETRGEKVFCSVRDIKVLFIKSTLAYLPSYLMFDLPLTEEKQWNWSGAKIENNRSISAQLEGYVIGNEEIQLKDKLFDCKIIKIVTIDEHGNSEDMTLWLAPEVGIVQGNIKLDGSGIFGLLVKIIGNEIDIKISDYNVIPDSLN